MTLRRGAAALAGAALVAAFATGCSGHGATATPAATPSSEQSSAQSLAQSSAQTLDSSEPSSVTASAPAPTTDPATSTHSTTVSPPPATGDQSAAGDLAAITRDLAGIDAGTAAAGRDLTAGDAARAQDDEG